MKSMVNMYAKWTQSSALKENGDWPIELFVCLFGTSTVEVPII